jgi:hypothetical protein
MCYLHGGWLDLLDMEQVGLGIDGIQDLTPLSHETIAVSLGYGFISDRFKKADRHISQ